MLLKVTSFAAFGLCVAGMASQQVLAADRAPASRVLQYRADSGETSFALVLEAKSAGEVSTERDHVVLFDTSASQTGEHRKQALAVLESFLKALPATDRIRLLGVDVEPKELTDGFVAASSVDATKAYQRLARRAPLGATDLGKALNAAIAAVQPGRSTTLVYVGDGFSSLNLLQETEMKAIVGQLRSRHVPFNSFAVGPKRDLQLLGMLANLSGGVVNLDDGEVAASAAGQQLAKSATASVFYPSEIRVEGARTRLFPAEPLPIRSDRETVLLGKGQIPTQISVSQGATKLSWSIGADQVQDDQTFVSTLVQRAEQEPLNVPFAGTKLLDIAKSEFAARVNQLNIIGDAALFDHDLKKAEAAGKAIREIDPKNEGASRLLASATKLKTKLVSQPAEAQDPSDAASTTGDTRQEAGALIGQMEAKTEIITQHMRLQVERTIESARALGAEDPDASINLLKKAQGAVSSTEDMDPDVRLNLLKRLQGVLADIKGQKEVQEERQIRQRERVAANEAQKRLIAQMQLDDERMEQLIDRVRALLDEAARGNPSAYGEAEAVANVALNLRPGNGTATAAKTGAVAARQLYVAYYLRNLRADRFLETLEQVERSHVSFPDEPPIRWPAPEVWKQLSERRKQYASVDLHKSSGAEKRITAALDDQSSVQFVEQPLKVAIEYLSSRHEIPILLDKVTLEAAGITEDTPITLTVAGVPLRSILNLMLKEHNLTYVIQNDVMMITTVEEAGNRLQTRVYPVGDLVINLNAQSLGGTGGGALGGAFGGGLGGGGQVGGGGGMMGGGGGGGFFNVPAAVMPQVAQRKAPQAAVKKAVPVAPKALPAAAPRNIAPAAPKAENADPELNNILDGILKEEAAVRPTKPFAGFAQVKDDAPTGKKKP